MQEQMQRPEVQEQMKEAQALMQDKGFAEKVEKLQVSWLAASTRHVAYLLRVRSSRQVIALLPGALHMHATLEPKLSAEFLVVYQCSMHPPRHCNMQYMSICTHY